jgi:hypothetical protein
MKEGGSELDKKMKSTAKLATQTALAGAAAFMVVSPSITYAEQEGAFWKISFPFCTILTGFLINLYAIRRLMFAIEHGVAIRSLIVLSAFWGTLSAFPSFFMELDLSDDINPKTFSMALAVLLGTTPMQVLGVWEFYDTLKPYMRRARNRFSANADYLTVSELQRQEKMAVLFLSQLEKNSQLLLLAERHIFDKAVRDRESDNPDALLQALFCFENPGNPRFQENSTNAICSISSNSLNINQSWARFCGYLGALLAQAYNVSFTKAAFDIFSRIMPMTGVIILTTFTTLPMVMLSADFGYHGLHGAWLTVIHFIQQFCNLVSRRNFQWPLPLALHPFLGLSISLCMILFGFFSYAGLIQFNNETLASSLSLDNLAFLNNLTRAGGTLFNTFSLLSIGHEFTFCLLARASDKGIRDRALFYQFMQAVQSGYRSLLKTQYYEEVENYLSLPLDEPCTEKKAALTPIHAATTLAPNFAFYKTENTAGVYEKLSLHRGAGYGSL